MRSGLPCKPGTRVALSLAIVVILGRTETALGADDLQRRWLVLRTEGPVGAVRALAFSPDSSCLYAAGLDKCVHTWSLRTSPEGVVNARHTRYLQWEVSRANRGCFYAMAVASDGWIAAAGTSARDATGDIVLFDPATHQIAEMLPSSRPVSSKTPPTGHGDVVVSLAFSPSGEHLASVDMAGEVRIWSAQDGFGSESSVLRRGDRRYSSAQQPAVFLDDQLLAVAHRDVATGKHSVRIYDVKRRAFKQDIATDYPVNGRVVSRRVVSLGRDPFHPHRWAFATEAGNVEFRMGLEGRSTHRASAASPVLGLAFATNRRILLTTAKTTSTPASVECWRLDATQVLREAAAELGQADHGHCCAVSPDGKYGAAYAPDGHEIWLCGLDPEAQSQSQTMFETAERVRLTGWGGTVKAANFAREGYQLAFQLRDGENLGFDLAETRLLRETPQTQMPSGGKAGAWRSEIGARRQTATLTGPMPGDATSKCSVGLEYEADTISATCWVHGESGEPIALAVATTPLNAIYIFGLSEDGVCPIRRYFRGHRDRIASLSVSHDGKYLASVSRDQTVSIWSLDGIGRRDARASAWGATFAVEDNGVRVQAVQPGGTAARRDLRSGDTITWLRYRDKSDQVHETVEPSEILRELLTQPLWRSVLLKLERMQDPEDSLLIVPGWNPVMTLFIARNRQWALWTPEGFYNASVEGDELFGWQVNRGFGMDPAVFPAARFRQELERPDLMRRLLEAGSLQKALREEQVLLSQSENEYCSKLIASKPNVRIVQPAHNQSYSQKRPIKVRALVYFPPPCSPEQYRVQAIVDQTPSDPKPVGELDERRCATVEFDLEPPAPNAMVYVRVLSPDGRMHHEDQVPIRVSMERPHLKVHLVALAAAKYSADQLANLSSIEDVMGLLEELKRCGSGTYDLASSTILSDEEISRSTLDRCRQELQENRLDEDDVLLFYLSGHGDVAESKYRFLLPDYPGPLCTPEQLEETSLTWEDLQHFASLPCRKLFVIDTCKAGRVTTDMETSSKLIVRPLRQEKAMVFCSAAAHQYAISDPGGSDYSVFARYLMEAIGGNADSNDVDQMVDLNEAVTYVTRKVKNATFDLQTPTLYREGELPDLMTYPLFLSQKQQGSERGTAR